jgi:hypothetical protein
VGIAGLTEAQNPLEHSVLAFAISPSCLKPCGDVEGKFARGARGDGCSANSDPLAR